MTITGYFAAGVQRKFQVGYHSAFYDCTHHVLHLGFFWIQYTPCGCLR